MCDEGDSEADREGSNNSTKKAEKKSGIRGAEKYE